MAHRQILWLVGFCSWILSSGAYEMPTLVYNVTEEQAGSDFTADVAQDSGLLQNLTSSDIEEFRFSFMSNSDRRTELFNLNQRTGIIETNAAIDREDICAFQTDCIISADIAVHVRRINSNQFELLVFVPVRINIVDINDNPPEFSEASIRLTVPESVPLNYSLMLSGPTDKDSGSNAALSFYLLPESDYFKVTKISNIDGSTDVALVVKRTLDFESSQTHALRVVAVDGGSPRLSAVVDVNIFVQDVNDVRPTFSNKTFRVNVSEDVTVGTTILQLSAVDNDSGENSKMAYSISTRTSGEIKSMFSLDSTTGVLTLLQSLDFEREQQYTFMVEVKDNGLRRLSSQALVEVRILDINDNSPSISIKMTENNDIVVSEISTVGSFIAEMDVRDLDSGVNGDVTCLSRNPKFTLHEYYNKLYKIKLRQPLDFEASEIEYVTVSCRDHGQPSFTTELSFDVHVEDANDNSPIFVQDRLEVRRYENNQIGDTITTVRALDLDSGDNGRVTYSINRNWSHMLSVNPTTGVVVASTVFDHEEASDVVFTVTATDNGSNRLSATVTIILTILDINDNVPSFDRDEYVFHVSEHDAVGRVIGKVLISDPDDSSGGVFTVKFHGDNDMFSTFFDMNFESGHVFLTKPIDREYVDSIDVILEAKDHGLPQLSSSVSMKIIVDDENDNAPVITYPIRNNNSVIITSTAKPGEYVTTIIALDRDFGYNAKLLYRIEADDSELFDIEVNTGIITTRRFIRDFDVKSHILVIAVSDHGLVSRESRTDLNIMVVRSNESSNVLILNDYTNDDNQNMTVVIILVSSTFIISLAVILTIVFIRRMDHSRDEQEKMKIKLAKDFASNIESNPSEKYTEASHDSMDSAPGTSKMVTFTFKDPNDIAMENSLATFQKEASTFTFRPGGMYDKKVQQPYDSSSETSEYSANDSGRGNSDVGHEDYHTISPKQKGCSEAGALEKNPPTEKSSVVMKPLRASVMRKHCTDDKLGRESFRGQSRRDVALSMDLDYTSNIRRLTDAYFANEQHQDQFLAREFQSHDDFQSVV